MGFGLLTHTHTPTHTAPPLQGLCSCRISSSQQRTGFCPCQSKITGPHRRAEHAATQSDWNPTKKRCPCPLSAARPPDFLTTVPSGQGLCCDKWCMRRSDDEWFMSRQFSSSSLPDAPRAEVALQSRQFSASAHSSCTRQSPVLIIQLQGWSVSVGQKSPCKVTSSHPAARRMLCLPRNLHMEVPKALCLPRNLHGGSQRAVPGTTHGGAQSAVPATKSAQGGPQSAAHAMKCTWGFPKRCACQKICT